MALFGKSAPALTTISPPSVGLAGEPYLVFQPAVDLGTGRLLGFEALLRWTNGSGGSVPPDILIPWAEAKGHMTALNAWVLSDACAQAARWPSALQLAVNCSVFQLRRGEAAIAAASALERSGLDPSRLTIEVTEASVADSQTTADLHAIHRLGIQLAIDDVESESSILDNLQDCVVNTMKIDATVIAGLGTSEGANRTVVEAIVGLSRSLGIRTVAEAVETADQVAILRELGVEIAQGYFFSPPLSAGDADDLAMMEPLPTFPLTAPVDLPSEDEPDADPVTPPSVPSASSPDQVPGAVQPEPAAVPVGSAPHDGPVVVQTKPLTVPIDPVPHQAPVVVRTRSLSASTPAFPDQAPVVVRTRPLSTPAPAFPDQAPVAVQTRPLSSPAPAFPDQAPVAVQTRPLSVGQPQPSPSATDIGPVIAGQEERIDRLTQGIAQLVTAVERLNELLEPLSVGFRPDGDARPGDHAGAIE